MYEYSVRLRYLVASPYEDEELTTGWGSRMGGVARGKDFRLMRAIATAMSLREQMSCQSAGASAADMARAPRALAMHSG